MKYFSLLSELVRVLVDIASKTTLLGKLPMRYQACSCTNSSSCCDLFLLVLQPLSVFNDTKMPFPLTVQLCDKLENPSDEPNVKVVLNTDRGIKVGIEILLFN